MHFHYHYLFKEDCSQIIEVIFHQLQDFESFLFYHFPINNFFSQINLRLILIPLELISLFGLLGEEVGWLDGPFSTSEVTQAHKDMALTKSPGPNGFHALFLSTRLEYNGTGYIEDYFGCFKWRNVFQFFK